MTEKKKRAASHPRRERRYVPEATHTTRGAAALGMLGSGLLGAGVMGEWILETPHPAGQAMVAVGTLGLAVGLWLGSATPAPLRVGEAGVAVERGREILRILWCDVEEIRLSGDVLEVRAKAFTLAIPLGASAVAVADVVAQADRRRPSVVRLDEAARRRLPAAREPGGEDVAVVGEQIAGRRCAATGQILAFERDARLCPECAQAYEKSHVPEQCATCGAALAGRAIAL